MSNSPDTAVQEILKWTNLEFGKELNFLTGKECFLTWSRVEADESKGIDFLKKRPAPPISKEEEEEAEGKQFTGRQRWRVDIFLSFNLGRRLVPRFS